MFTYLLALDQIQQTILKINVQTGASSVLVDGLDAFPDGIVVDPERAHVYWTNMGTPGVLQGHAPKTEQDLDFSGRNGSIERIDIDGTNRTFIVEQGGFFTGKQLAGAWSTGRLYWSDREGAAVMSARLDGAELRTEIFTAATDEERSVVRNQCVGVTIDEQDDMLYWTQTGPAKGGDGRIFRVSLKAPVQDRTIEVLWSGLPEPIDLHLETASNMLYWTDRGDPPRGNTVNRAAVPAQSDAGGKVTVISENYHEAIGLTIDSDTETAYAADLSGEIRAIDLRNGGERTVFQHSGGNITGIAGL